MTADEPLPDLARTPAETGDPAAAAAALRARQAPLKDRYRSDPESACTPLLGQGSFSEPGISCTVDTFAGPVRAGLHTATGGDGSDACSGDMLLQALAACAGVTLRSVATAMRVPLRAATVSATGYFDARGTLGVDRDAPVGVQSVELNIIVDTDADEPTLQRLAVATERYCVVGQSLAHAPRIRVLRAAASISR